ncbi:hypothetical protein CsSME_00005722 [Camellia sinensis var. sinensis]
MAHDLSSQLPLTLKSQTSSLVLAAKNTSNSVLNWISDDFLTLKSRSLGSELSETNASEQSTISSVGNEIRAEDAVSLLLKHKRGYHPADDEAGHNIEDDKMPKRVLGPERPSFLDSKMDYESWVPPKGQSGDGRTSLNDRFGY